jgi:hypothetical protein
VFSVIRPRPAFATWFPYKNDCSVFGFTQTCVDPRAARHKINIPQSNSNDDLRKVFCAHACLWAEQLHSSDSQKHARTRGVMRVNASECTRTLYLAYGAR